MVKEYFYSPLESKHSIRVFRFSRSLRSKCRRLFRGSDTEGSLLPLDLSIARRSPYVALSYTWSSPFASGLPAEPQSRSRSHSSILCDGREFSVGSNLFCALSILRTVCPRVPIWIDALCINQRDNDEKNSQVSMMGEIYSKASLVYVWLGPHDSSSRIAVRIIEKVNCALSNLPPYQTPRGHYVFNDPVLFQIIGMEQITVAEWQSVVDFFCRTWFHRVWITQEGALSTDLVILCGDSKISKKAIRDFTLWITELRWDQSLDLLRRDKADHEIGGIGSFLHVMELNYRMQLTLEDPETKHRLEQFFGAATLEAFLALMLIQSRSRLATDQRDKVFAPLALACMMKSKSQSLRRSEWPFPDYRKGVESVYMEVSEFLISRLGNLALLSFVERLKVSKFNLPSWTPDFSTGTINRPFTELNHNATKPWVASAVPNVEMRQLQVSGILFDKIVCTTSDHVDPNRDLTPIFDLIYCLDMLAYPKQSHIEVLLRTLVQDRFEYHWIPKAPYQEYFAAIPAQTVLDSFKQWIKVRVAVYVSQTSAKPTASDIPPKLYSLCGQSPFFPTATELTEFITEFTYFTQPGPNHDVYLSEMHSSKHLFDNMISGFASTRCLFRSGRNNLGLGPLNAQPWDQVWFLNGAKVPFLLRTTGSGTYSLVGEAYLHGFMQGEIFTTGGMSMSSAKTIFIE